MTTRPEGFVLVEVLVTIALLIGAVVSLALVVARSATVNTMARHTTLAALMATDKLEELRGVPFDGAAMTVSTPDSLTVDRDGFFDEPAPGWRRRWSITPLPAAPRDAVVISVAAFWAGSPAQAVLTTVRARRAA